MMWVEVLTISYINFDFYYFDYSSFLYPVSENLKAPQPHLHVVPVGFLLPKSKEAGTDGVVRARWTQIGNRIRQL
jgi:hypothetical protein